jgi:hypothetical protein
MVARIAVGLVAALRAALIYGDGADLSTRPLQWPRRMRAAGPFAEPAPIRANPQPRQLTRTRHGAAPPGLV